MAEEHGRAAQDLENDQPLRSRPLDIKASTPKSGPKLDELATTPKPEFIPWTGTKKLSSDLLL